MSPRSIHLTAFALFSLASLSGCARPGSDSETLIVFAAASLTEAFTEIAEGFEAEHPEVDVLLNAAGSQTLALQLSQGAPADVFASADETQMAAAIAAGRVRSESVQLFAANRLVVVVPETNPGDIRQLADLARPGLQLILASEAVPAGRYALAFLASASQPSGLGGGYQAAVLANVVSYEEDVRRVLSKVALGEADGGIVYASDVRGSGSVAVLEIPDAWHPRIVYPIAPVSDSANLPLAHAFVDYVLGAHGRASLAASGFLPYAP